ncbi:DNA-directed RNA polymerase II subunit RPB4 SCDLUD_002614 [Saccharomycodes ludwigii]|uniref:DNA-directed RNA polymerase II subunit RPB4 n=1 Tax=Saccharomycodes ludwigii TaxID=36035 RepID=UPI001E8B3C83|nr:hypothetical protein SCDLUD_002614 [Saccharomycodes ludwigii]KAH3901132.1 hypothetical protein SCDLUD_002614 [Saccharomycodes ludwigii]
MNISTSTFLTKRRGLKRLDEEQEENAATLQLGDEFQLQQLNHQGEEEELVALSLSEARLVIRESLQERKRLFQKWYHNDTGVKAEVSGVEEEEHNSSDLQKNEDIELFNNQQSVEEELANIDRVLEATTPFQGTNSSSNKSNDNEKSRGVAATNNQALKQTLVYLANFSRFRDPETVTAVAQLLRSITSELHPFEIAQLGSLSCEDADEAKTLIPSLNNKISDEELERILKELSNLETLY